MFILLLITLTSGIIIKNKVTYKSRGLQKYDIDLNDYGFTASQQIYLTIQINYIAGSYPYFGYCVVNDDMVMDIMKSVYQVQQHIETQKKYCMFDNNAVIFNYNNQAIQLQSHLTNEDMYNKFSVYELQNLLASLYIYSDKESQYTLSIEASIVGGCIQNCNKNGICSNNNDQYACICSLAYIDGKCSQSVQIAFAPVQLDINIPGSSQQLIVVSITNLQDVGLDLHIVSQYPVTLRYACYLDRNYVPFTGSTYAEYSAQSYITIPASQILDCQQDLQLYQDNMHYTIEPRIILSVSNPNKNDVNVTLDIISGKALDKSNEFVYYIVAAVLGGLILVLLVIVCIIYYQRGSRRIQTKENNMRKLKKYLTIEDQMPRQLYKKLIVQYPGLTDISECLICLTDFTKTDFVRLTLCAHLFHSKCIDEWMKRNETCPFCRDSLSSKALKENANAHQIFKMGQINNDEEDMDQHQIELQRNHAQRMQRLRNLREPTFMTVSPIKDQSPASSNPFVIRGQLKQTLVQIQDN